MFYFLAAVFLAIVITGCAVVFGSGQAETRINRQIDVASDNEAQVAREVVPKDKKQ